MVRRHKIPSAEGPAGRLLADFGGKAQRTRQGVRAFYQALGGGQAAAEAAIARWQELSRKLHGQAWPGPKVRLDVLAAHYAVPAEGLRPEALLLALESWYAVLVRLFMGEMLAAVGPGPSPAQRLLGAEAGPGLRKEIESLFGGQSSRERSGCLGCEPWLAWYAAACPEAVQQAIRSLAAPLLHYDAAWWLERGKEGRDLLKPLYQDLFPRVLRHSLGEYYTPDWLAEHVLDQAGYCGQAGTRLLDPACGSGTFLVAAIRRLRKTGCNRGEIVKSIVGLDLHPLAAMTARANYLLAIVDLLAEAEPPEIPVYTCDAILDGPGPGVVADGFDYVVGNPPWIAWDNLPPDYRVATRPLWQGYGLFSLSAREARHGGGKKDLAMLMLYVSADRYLRRGGRLGMVVTQTAFQTKGAGDGFRRFRLGPDGDWLGVLRVDDLVAVRPFGDASNWSSTIVLEKGRATQYPVPYVKWLSATERQACLARPIAADRPGSPWLVWPATSVGWVDGHHVRMVGEARQPRFNPFPVGLADQRCASVPVDPPYNYNGAAADYTAHLGANSGGANAVYWLEVLARESGGVRVRNLTEKGKRTVEAVETVIEPDLLYPLVRWADVDCYCARPSAHLLLAQDASTRAGREPAWMERHVPRTYAYLQRFEALLQRRAAYRRYQDRKPFYSMYNVGPYTLAPVKVVWRRMDRRIRAAVLEAVDDPWLGRWPVVPQETCVLVACGSEEEAHYLCAVLNSGPANRLVAAHSVVGGKGFGTPGILDFLPIRFYDGRDPRHAALAACSRQAHALQREQKNRGTGDKGTDEQGSRRAGELRPAARGAGGQPTLGDLAGRIDRLVADLWDLPTGCES